MKKEGTEADLGQDIAFGREVEAHLNDVCRSAAFTNSKRCQEFLRYVVHEALRGRSAQIKERTIACEVFGKGPGFEPGEFSLVRVKASEVRKRLADYYQSAPVSHVRIDLPLGSYAPIIQRSPSVPASESPLLDVPVSEASPHEPLHNEVVNDAEQDEAGVEVRHRKLNRRRLLWLAGGGASVVGASIVITNFGRKSGPLDLLWKPVFATKEPLLIFIPVMHGTDGQLTEWVGMGPTASLRRAADFLTLHHYPYHLRFGAELTYSQMREQPTLLLGGFSSDWTRLMVKDLRFVPVVAENGVRGFQDRQSRQVWKAVKKSSSPYTETDLGILCRLFDAATGQIILLAVGCYTFGTEGAADLLFKPDLFSQVLAKAPKEWETKNFQMLVRVSVVGVSPSAPQLIASHFW
jgi:hypothetical protein